MEEVKEEEEEKLNEMNRSERKNRKENLEVRVRLSVIPSFSPSLTLMKKRKKN